MSYATRFEQVYRDYAMWAYQDVPKWASFFEVPLDVYDFRQIEEYQCAMKDALKLIEPYIMKCVRNSEDYAYCHDIIGDCIGILQKNKNRYEFNREEHAELYECVITDLKNIEFDIQYNHEINSIWEDSDDDE